MSHVSRTALSRTENQDAYWFLILILRMIFEMFCFIHCTSNSHLWAVLSSDLGPTGSHFLGYVMITMRGGSSILLKCVGWAGEMAQLVKSFSSKRENLNF